MDVTGHISECSTPDVSDFSQSNSEDAARINERVSSLGREHSLVPAQGFGRCVCVWGVEF